MDSKKLLIALSVRFDGNWNEIYGFITRREEISEEEINTLCSKVKCKVITILDDNYPSFLKRCKAPPFVLYYEGDISLIQTEEKHVAVVGSRKASPFYLNVTKEIVSKLDKDIVVVSGLASGIDASAHQAALDSGKKTIAVIGCGINVVFPTENAPLYKNIKEKGLLLTEYPPGSRPFAAHFPLRNRIISSLSHCVLVPQAAVRSGSIITVGYALDEQKEVLCVPSQDLNNSACNILIKEGAVLVENADDVMYYLT